MLSIDIAESRDAVQAFAAQHRLTFPIPLDETGAVAQTYRVRAVPYSVFIDRQGVIRTVHIGPMDKALLDELLGPML